jgi:hypothetical protein
MMLSSPTTTEIMMRVFEVTAGEVTKTVFADDMNRAADIFGDWHLDAFGDRPKQVRVNQPRPPADEVAMAAIVDALHRGDPGVGIFDGHCWRIEL